MTTNKEATDAMLAHITSECKSVDLEAEFDSMLDECYSFDSVGGPFAGMSPSRVLRECDPTAHRCGVADYSDGQGYIEIGNDSYQADDVDKAKEDFIDEMKSELEDAEKNLAEYVAEPDPDKFSIEETQKQIDALRENIEACEDYQF